MVVPRDRSVAIDVASKRSRFSTQRRRPTSPFTYPAYIALSREALLSSSGKSQPFVLRFELKLLAFCAIYPGSQVPLRVLSLPHSIHLSLFSTIKKTLPCSSGRKVTGGCRRPPFSPSTTSAGIKTSLNTPVPTTAGSLYLQHAPGNQLLPFLFIYVPR